MKILGIDPGSQRIGYGLIEKKQTKLKLLDYGVLELKNKDDLLVLANRFENLIKKFQPHLVALEKLYFVRNQKTGMAVAQARGVLILKILEKNIELTEFGPTEIKQAVAGYGRADKKALAMMVKRLLNIEELKGYDDASDALAIAITAVYSRRYKNPAS